MTLYTVVAETSLHLGHRIVSIKVEKLTEETKRGGEERGGEGRRGEEIL